jgi:hypothetical protein
LNVAVFDNFDPIAPRIEEIQKRAFQHGRAGVAG